MEEARLPSRNTGFDSVTGKKNSSVIKGHGHDGITHSKEGGGEGTGWLQEWMNWPIERYPPSPIPLKIINV